MPVRGLPLFRPLLRPALTRRVRGLALTVLLPVVIFPAVVLAQPTLPSLKAPQIIEDDTPSEDRSLPLPVQPQVIDPDAPAATRSRSVTPVPEPQQRLRVNPQPVTPRPVTPSPATPSVIGPQIVTPRGWSPVPYGMWSPQAIPHVTLRVPDPQSNLQVIVPELVANRLLGRPRSESEPVHDCILGANILGQQSSVTSVTIDFHPRVTGVHATMRLEGLVNAETRGRTPQAEVATVGHHRIRGTKEIFYDGKVFSTQAAVVFAAVNNTNVAASTPLDGVPLIGGLARGIAVGVANGQRRRSDPIAWQRVSTAVYEKFNKEVDKQLAQANKALEKEVRPKLRELSVYPARETVASTDTHLIYTALLRDGGLPSVVSPPATSVSSTALTVRVHDSLLNQVAESLHLEGQSHKPSDLTKIIERLIEAVGGRADEIKTGEPPVDDTNSDPADSSQTQFKQTQPPTLQPGQVKVEPSSKTKPLPNLIPVQGLGLFGEPMIVFAEQEAIRCRFDQGLLTVTLIARIEIGGRAIVPTQRIQIPYRATLVGDELVIKREAVIVEAVDPSTPELQQTYANLVRPRVEETLSEVALPRHRTLPAPINRQVRIERLDATASWLTVEIGLE